ncbi:GDSL esterase/lipase [Trifolium pratense]|uniref:GDSL esterase/lipase n=1 Tax=Trifolium pratense TaxID=57577 RepID=A0A2K3LKJ9_TRIPR|nr:GDSL esterase/lipase [Trifolium pratense]
MECLLMVSLALWSMLMITVLAYDSQRQPLFSAIFVFGDSLVDNGNNNKLHSIAKANYMPYGIDFPGVNPSPTGRFSNGKTIVDFLGEMVGIPLLPPFADIIEQNIDISRGVNFASASSGILNETGRNLGERISFSHQGNNDYINNYLMPGFYGTSFVYNPKTFADILIENYKRHILDLHSLGLRKFFLAAIRPLGCIPYQISQGMNPSGQCRSNINDMVVLFNTLLRSLVDQLNTKYTDSIFVYGDTYEVFNELIKDPDSYGFTVSDAACCGFGRNKAQINCLPMTNICPNRDQYVFWDPFHPTQAVSKIMANKAFNGPPSVCHPINVIQMAQKHLPPGQNNASSML